MINKNCLFILGLILTRFAFGMQISFITMGGESIEIDIPDEYSEQIHDLPKDSPKPMDDDKIKDLFYKRALIKLLELTPYTWGPITIITAFPTISRETGKPFPQYSVLLSCPKYDFIKLDDNTFRVVVTPYQNFKLVLTQLDNNKLQVNIFVNSESEQKDYQFDIEGNFTLAQLQTKPVSDLIVNEILIEALDTRPGWLTMTSALQLSKL